MQNVEMLKNTRFEQTGIENCGLYTVKTHAGGCVVGVNNVKNGVFMHSMYMFEIKNP